MSDDNIVFVDSTGPKTFVENLSNLLRVDKASAFDTPARQAMTDVYIEKFGQTDSSLGVQALNDFFLSFNSTTNPLQDWNQFFSKSGSDDRILQGFIDSYREILALGPTGEDPIWSGLNITDEDIEKQFKNSFSHFLSSYPYQEDGTVGPDDGSNVSAINSFFTNWVTYMATTAALALDNGAPSQADLSNYLQIYTALFGDDDAAFNTRLRDFYDEILKKTGDGDPAKGWFIPSQVFDDWFETMKSEYTASQTISSVGADEPNRVIVIDRILKLLIVLVEVLQRISVAQANRLSFLTKWQSAYTDLITGIPKFTQGDGTAMGEVTDPNSQDYGQDRDSRKELRTEVNSEFDSLLQKAQARRSVVQDEAKQMQTTINTSQDAANQQTQMGTALLQQLSTILSQIFR